MKKISVVIPLVFLVCFAFNYHYGGEIAKGVTPEKQVPSGLKNAHDTFFKGILAEDTTILDSVLSDDVTFGFPGGLVVTREMYLSALQSGDLSYDTAEHEAVEFHLHGNTAVVTGRSNLVYRYKGEEDLERLAYTSTYIKSDGVWEMVAWQSTDRDSIVELEAVKAQAEVEEQNIALMKRVYEGMRKGDFDILRDSLSPDYAFYTPSGSTNPLNVDKTVGMISAFYNAFPDIGFNIVDIIAKGDQVIIRESNQGIHQGEFGGIPATGKKIDVSLIAIFRIQEGKIVETWEEANMLDIMQQLGMELKPKEGE
ncbi:ester cyclase [Acidobacteriota bacterium]